MDLEKNNRTPGAMRDQIQQLQEENARLKALLTGHGIRWEEEPPPATETQTEMSRPFDPQRSGTEKIALFRSLFRGRTDVYSLRWESTRGRSGRDRERVSPRATIRTMCARARCSDSSPAGTPIPVSPHGGTSDGSAGAGHAPAFRWRSDRAGQGVW